MACRIETTNDGKINKVLDENNEPSKLFQSIFNIPILTLEQSLDVYKNTFSSKVTNTKESNSIEPTLIFETPSGETFTNYKDALQNTDLGDINLKVNDVIVGKVNSDTSIETYEGSLNYLTKQGVLSGTKILDVDGSQITVVAGDTDTAKQLTSDLVETIATKLLGASGVTRLNTGDFIFTNNLNKRVINGEQVDEKAVNDMNFEQLKANFGEETAISIETEREFEKQLLPSTIKKRIDEDSNIKTEDELIRNIKSLVNSLGVKITSIEDYDKNYALKNDGAHPDAPALMDMVNKIMAFRNGEVTREDLIEETMHLIEASLDPNITEPVRKMIHTTPEWKEHSALYYEIYSKEYSGDKIEEIVRREILGKVMSNAISTNFEISQDATLTQQSIFQQIKNFLQQFFDKVNSYFGDNTQSQIEELNQNIFVKLMAGQLGDELDVNQNFGTKFRLYSASKNISNDLVQIERQAQEALNVLESQAYQIAKTDASQRQLLRQLRESLGKVSEQFDVIKDITDIVDKSKAEQIARAELATSFSYITNVAQKQLKYLQRAVKRNAQNNYHFSSEEEAVYATMISQFDRHILPAAKKTLESKENRTKAENRILEEINKTIEEVNSLKGSVSTLERKSKDVIVDLLTRRLDLTDEQRAFVQSKVDGLQAESNFMFFQFGNLMHSSNLYLNAVGHVVTKVDQEKRSNALNQLQPFISRLKNAGFLNAKVKEFAKDGYIQNRFNDKARESAVQQKRYELYKEISGEDISKEDFEKLGTLTKLNTSQTIELNQKLQDWQLENITLSALSPDEVRERKQRLANYSEVTQNYERNSSLAYNDIMSNAEINGNIPLVTEDMKYDFEKLKKQRAYDKSIFNIDGEKKDGIEYRTEGEYNRTLVIETINDKSVEVETDIVKISNGLYASLTPNTTDSASILAFELSKIDNNRIVAIKAGNTNDKEFSPEFVQMLSSMDSKQAYDFLTLNSYIGYSNEYYDSFDRPSIIDKLTDELGGENDWKIQDLIEKIATTTKKMNTILTANRVMNQPGEVSYDNMEKNSEVPAVKEYSQELESYYSQASTLVNSREEIEEDNISETIPNQSFRSYMSDKHTVSNLIYNKEILDQDDTDNIDKIFSEIIDHSTQKNKQKVLELRSFVRDFSAGKINKIPKTFQRVFSKTADEYSDLSEEQVFASMTSELLKYSYTRLLPYFRKTQPTAVDRALFDLQAGIIKPADFMTNYLNGDYQYLNITPNYNFQRANEVNNKNPHFNQAKVNGTPLFRTFELSTTEQDVKTKSVDQLYNEGKLNKFVNKEFLKEYDIDLVHLFNTGEEVARKNEKKFEARQAFVDLQKQSLENYGMTNSHNLYLLPQKEQNTFRKIEDVLKTEGGIKSILDELVNFRQDEASLGQDTLGNASRNYGSASIPKLGLRRLTDGKVSDELIQSYTWLNNESNLYKARVENVGDMLAIKEALLGSEFENNLNVESTNVYKMFEDAMKYNFYGVKEVFSKEFNLFGKTADWGKILKSFGNLIRFRNLAFNITIPITSALSGSTQLRIEQLVGERVDTSALQRANKLFMKTSGDAMRETLGFEGSSWLSAMGAKWGWYENEERFNNSNYGKTVRGLGRSAFIMHTAGNFPVNSRVGLSVLSDHRFVDGKLIQFRDFKASNTEKSNRELRTIWETYIDVNQVSVVDEAGVVKYDYKKIADALNTGITEEQASVYMTGKEPLIFGRVKTAIQAVDQQISATDRSIASRNSIFNFLTIHRGWLTLAVQSRFKGRQLSTVSGRIEEGTIRTAFRYLNEIVADVKSGKATDMLKYLKEKWQSSDTTTKKNLQRSAVEITVLNLLVGLLVLASKELADDDEDSYLFKLSSLFLMRTTNEIASSTTALPLSVYSTLTNAVVGLNVLDTAFDVGDLASDDLVSKGQYSGMSKRQRYLLRHIPGLKDYNSLFNNIDETINSYEYFNFVKDTGTLDYLTIYNLLMSEQGK